MSDKTVWFVTGASRGMGVEIVKAALAAGHAVVATGRNSDAVGKAVGFANDLVVVKLDVTSPDDAKIAVEAALKRFGRIDVLVNNAGNFYAGFFEEISPDDFRAQVETNFFKRKASELLAQANAHRVLSSSLAHDDAGR